VSTLLAYSLVKRANIGSISIHSLIHMWARERFSREEQADKSYEALGVMADAVRLENEYTRSNADWVFERKAMLHTQLSLSKALKFWPQRQLRETEILQFRDIALLFQLHGKYTEAELQYNRALQSAATLYGGGDFRILEIELGLAKVYRLQHRILEAKERYQNCIAGFGRSLPPLAVQNLLSKEGLATTLHDESNFREAKELHEEAITGLKLVLGEGHPETLLAMGNLATTLLRQINYKEAEILYRDILEMSTGQSGEAHFNSLRIRQNLALCLEMQDRLDEARLEYDILVGLRKEMLGIDHPSTLRVMQNLAWVHYRQEDFKGAENLYGAVVAGREKVLGVNHFDTLRAVRNMAKVLIASGQSDKARPYLTRALDGFQAQSESICGDYVDSVKRALKQLGKLSEAQLPANDPASFQTKAGIVEM
jgi:tetratricopeptide (TPR) repeat protein